MSSDYNSVSELYGHDYYSTGFGGVPYERNDHWLNFFGGIAAEIIRSLRPGSVFDAGCGMGMLVESLWDRGVRAQGLDVSSYAIGNVRPDMRRWCRVGDLKDGIEGKYDLVTCIEVLEHMAPADAQAAIQHLANAAETVLFSSTPNDFAEPTHINVQPVLYWLEAFVEAGFAPDLSYDASFVAPHAFVVRRSKVPPSPETLTGFSDLLRYRMALVERESRIGRLTAENVALTSLQKDLEKTVETLRISFSQNGAQNGSANQRRAESNAAADAFEETTSKHPLNANIDRSSLANMIDQFAGNASRFLNQVQERDREIRAALEVLRAPEHLLSGSDFHKFLVQLVSELRREFDEESFDRSILDEKAHALSSVLRNRESELDQLHRERTALSQRVASLEEKLKDAQRAGGQLKQLKESLDSQRYRLSQAESHLALYRRSLGEIHSSPGWKLILRYRTWLDRARGRKKSVRRYYEPAVNWLLRKSGLAAGRTAVAPVPFPTDAVESHSLPAVDELFSDSSGRGIALGELPSSNATECNYAEWYGREAKSAQQLDTERTIAQHLGYAPRISVILPVYKVPVPILREAVESVRRQTYVNWELCIAVGVPATTEVAEYCAGLPPSDDRIKVVQLDTNGGISENSNAALNLATGEFCALLDHDDLLDPSAFFEMARAVDNDPSIDFLYSDKDQISGDGKQHIDPLFKPDWSPEMMLSANFLTHLCVIRTDLLRQIGGWRKDTDGAQDWDIFLRAATSEKCRFHHVPKVLYHWRRIETSVSERGLDAKPYASAAQVAAVTPWLKHLGWNAGIKASATGYFEFVWQPEALAAVSVIVAISPDRMGDSLWLQRLVAETDLSSCELVVPDPLPVPEGVANVTEVEVPASASTSTIINRLASKAKFSHFVIITEPLYPKNPDWLQQLSGPLSSAEIGLVGPKILDEETSRIRSAGIAVDERGSCFEPFAGEPEFAYGPFGGAHWFRNWLAVSGACFAIRAETWRKLGGLNETTTLAREDVELCLRMQLECNLRVLYTPYATMVGSQHSNVDWGSLSDKSNRAAILANFPHGDPYFNKNLSFDGGYLRLRDNGNRILRPAPATDYGRDSRELVKAFDCSRELIERAKKASSRSSSTELRSVTWFLPDFSNARYGGINSILRAANYFYEKKGVKSTIATIGAIHPVRLRSTVEQVYPALAKSAEFVSASDYAAIDSLPPCDAAISTLWTTAYAALRYPNARQHFYFLQDWEPMFYPAGATSGLVEATFDFGFRGICNTRGVYDSYRERGGEGMYFDPCVDRDVFHNKGRRDSGSSSPLRLFCYARPGHPRNSFELAAEVLRRLKGRFGERLQILTAGSEWDPAQHALDGIVENLGLLGYRETGALYRSCHAGISLMMTRHPSYLPFELMACGALVVANHNRHNTWFFEDRVNCLLTTPTATCMTEAIEEALLDDKLRRNITEYAARWIHEKHGDWDRSLEAIYQYVANPEKDHTVPPQERLVTSAE